MYPGASPERILEEVLRRQAEIRAEARRGSEVRRDSRPVGGRGPAAFRLWRLHVMVWFERARKA